ncbi:NfeD family protein [Rubripirellula reticaptiva]|uniref:NfeD-like C-terminal domain-containing protein n=1 Tax=Rubripirellula reticaptiva TaxID=2528013 RepID=A0A5C6EJH1_9BACT|nr:NfeD family protein [Rubripirellula reticaptiva]TWU47806.1 hypothetical protein Poly59_46480 [Rubripirellula reticaptiva]
MNRFAFAPFVDLPLVAVALALFIWHFNRWASRSDLETNLDVAARLPSARRRVLALMAGVLLLCWYFNFAVWGVFALLLGAGLALALVIGGELDGGVSGLWAAAYLVREWSFGFPQIVLHPLVDDGPTSFGVPKHQLVGKTGTTSSPLRPIGDAIIDGNLVSVTSDDGSLLVAGTDVIVTSYRNGLPCVRVCVAAENDG